MSASPAGSRLPWHAAHWQLVERSQQEQRLPQALLLAGARGLGKDLFARQLGGLLLCESGGTAACGECRGCRQLAAGSHPDALLLSTEGLYGLAAPDAGRQEGAVPFWTPERDSKRKDIGVDGIRALIERLGLSSHYGQPRFALVSPADALNASGVNMLLKTIEEPPARVYLVLVAQRWRFLPATLRSRCQMLRFAPPPRDAALAWLKQQHPVQKEAGLRPWLRRPMEAANGLAADRVAMRAEWVGALAKVPAVAKGRWPIMKLQGLKREDAQFGLECWLETAGDWLRQRLAPGAAGEGVQGPPAEFDAARLTDLCDALVVGLRGLRRNGNPALIVESIIIRAAGVVPAGEN